MKSIIWEEKFLYNPKYKIKDDEFVAYIFTKENNKIYIKGITSILENMEWDELKKYSITYFYLNK